MVSHLPPPNIINANAFCCQSLSVGYSSRLKYRYTCFHSATPGCPAARARRTNRRSHAVCPVPDTRGSGGKHSIRHIPPLISFDRLRMSGRVAHSSAPLDARLREYDEGGKLRGHDKKGRRLPCLRRGPPLPSPRAGGHVVNSSLTNMRGNVVQWE